MLVQAVGSSALGSLIERGFAYDAVFVAAAALLFGTLVVAAGVERAGRLPA
jgi:hypothetical protein